MQCGATRLASPENVLLVFDAIFSSIVHRGDGVFVVVGEADVGS